MGSFRVYGGEGKTVTCALGGTEKCVYNFSMCMVWERHMAEPFVCVLVGSEGCGRKGDCLLCIGRNREVWLDLFHVHEMEKGTWLSAFFVLDGQRGMILYDTYDIHGKVTKSSAQIGLIKFVLVPLSVVLGELFPVVIEVRRLGLFDIQNAVWV